MIDKIKVRPIAQFLATVPGLKGISLEELEQIVEQAQIRTFAPNTYLIRRGEPGENMHILLSGRVRVPIFNDQGEEKMLFHLNQGSFVGEMALLTGDKRSTDVIAEKKVTSLVIDNKTFQPLLNEHPRLASFLSEILGQRLEEDGGIDHVGKYRLLGKLGEGSTGKVFEALHPTLNRAVAIKMLSHSLVYNEKFRNRFLNEARTVAGLVHPNIVQVFDTENAYATYFIIMEKLSGTDLAQLIKKHRIFTPEQASEILLQIGTALAYAHKRGFAHRDVKPANVAIDNKGNVKLMDFGLARPITNKGSGDQFETVEGTPQYIAPETAIGRGGDGRVDIYAVGIMAFEMVSGKLPFTSNKVIELLEQHVHTPPPDIEKLCPNLPQGLVKFIRGTLVKNPDKRLTDWKQLLSLLDLRSSTPEFWTEQCEQIIRIRYSPCAKMCVDNAVQTLAAELKGEETIEVSHGTLEPIP